MNLLLLTEADRRDASVFRVGGARAQHIARVLRKTVGDTVTIGLLEGPMGSARIVSDAEGAFDLECTFEPEVPARGTIDVAIAVPRPKMLRRILAAAAELGVDRVVLFRSWRVEKSYLESDALAPDAFVPHLLEGLAQARGTRLPRVQFAPTFREFLTVVPSLKAPAYVLHPGDGPGLRSVGQGRGTLVFGPEGGFIDREVESLEALGLVRASLGERILRCETALVYAVSAMGSATS